MIHKINKITEELDWILATLGLIFTLILIIVLVLVSQETAYKYIEAPIMLFLACVIYLLIRKRVYDMGGLSHLKELRANSYIILILNILFITLFSYSIFSVATRSELYSRPLGYFIATSLIVALLAIEILFLPKGKKYLYFVLLKIFLVALSLWWTPQLIFPAILGIDPWVHQMFTMKILELGYVPEGYSYSKLPLMHLIVGSTSLITNLDYKTSAMLSINVFYGIGLVFIFLIGRLIFNQKVGLMSALLLAIADKHIYLNIEIRPITLTFALIPLFLYIALKPKKENRIIFSFLALIFSGIIILTHTVGSVIVFSLIFSLWFAFEIFKKIYNTRFNIPITLNFSIFFIVAMLGWWMYATNFAMDFLGKLIMWGFTIDTPTWSRSVVSEHYLDLHKIEYMLDIFGFTLYFLFSFVGSFYMLSRRYVSKYGFALVLSSWFISIILFSVLVFNITGFHIVRWYPIVQLLMCIPAAIGILVISTYNYSKNGLRNTSVLFILISVVSFFAITGSFVSWDHPTYSKNISDRITFTLSELKAEHTISSIYDEKILTDTYYSGYFNKFQYYGENLPSGDISSNLISRNFNDTDGLIVIRKEIIEKPFKTIGGVYKLDFNPQIVLSKFYFNRIYDSGTVRAFWKI